MLHNDAFQSVQKNVKVCAVSSYLDTDPILWMLAKCRCGVCYRHFGGK